MPMTTVSNGIIVRGNFNVAKIHGVISAAYSSTSASRLLDMHANGTGNGNGNGNGNGHGLNGDASSPRERSRTVSAYYNQSAIDQMASKV